MPRSTTAIKPKTPEQLKAEVRPGQVRLEKDTKMIALDTGYYDVIREPGDVFWVKAGTIYTPGESWLEPAEEDTATTEELEVIEKMSVPELKVALAKAGVDFTGVSKKAELVALLAKANGEADLA